MAENILEQRLEELGVTPEQFVQLCEWGRNRSDVNRTVFDQITAIDDFLSPRRRNRRRVLGCRPSPAPGRQRSRR